MIALPGETYISSNGNWSFQVTSLGEQFLNGIYWESGFHRHGEHDLFSSGDDKSHRNGGDLWLLDGLWTGKGSDEHMLGLHLVINKGQALIKLCECPWNKHPLFCRCK